MGLDDTASMKDSSAFRTISEVSTDLGVPQHVLRFWETRFGQIRPMKRGGGRRLYRPDDVMLLRGIRHLLYSEGYTIRGVQRILKEQGVRFVVDAGSGTIVTESDVGADSAKSLDDVIGKRSSGSSSGSVLDSVLSDLLECKRLLDSSREPASVTSPTKKSA